MLLITFSFHSASFSQDKIISEFLFVLSENDHNSINDNTPMVWEGKTEKTIPSQILRDPYKTEISPIKLSLNYQVQTKSALNRDGKYPFFAYILHPKIEIQKIRTQDTVKERIGNLIVNVNISGHCQNLFANYQQAYIPVKGNILLKTVNGRLRLDLENFEFSYNSSLWDLNFSKCVGPKGYGEVLKNNIKDFLNNKNHIASLLEQGLKDQILETTASLNEQVLRIQKYKISENLSLELHPHSLKSNENRDILVYGWLALTFNKHKGGGAKYITFNKLDTSGKSETRLILPAPFGSAVVETSYNNGWLRHTADSRSIEGMSELTKSRFKQFFAWPDLMSFSKNTKFLFDIYAQGKPNVEKLSVDSGGRLNLSLASEVVNNMSYPMSHRLVPYVNFYSKMNGNLNIEVTSLGLRTTLSKLNVKSSYRFDANYAYQNNPNEYIDIKTLEKHLVNELLSQKIDFELGPIDLNLLGKFYPQKFQVIKDQIELIYKK